MRKWPWRYVSNAGRYVSLGGKSVFFLAGRGIFGEVMFFSRRSQSAQRWGFISSAISANSA